MFELDTQIFKALSDFASDDPTRAILNTICYNENGYTATNGHILGVIQPNNNLEFSTVNRDDMYTAYSYNATSNLKTKAEARKVGKYKKHYNLAERIPGDLPASAFPNATQLIPSKGYIPYSITLDEFAFEPVEMLANTDKCNIVSIFYQHSTNTLIWVPTIKWIDSRKVERVQRYGLKINLDGTSTEVSCNDKEDLTYLVSFDPRYLITLWNLVALCPGETKLHIEFSTDKNVCRFEDCSDGCLGAYGVIMPVQCRVIDAVKKAAL